MQIKQFILALCLSNFAFAKNHRHKNGTSVAGEDTAKTGTGTGVAAVSTGNAGRKKHGSVGTASNGTATAARIRRAEVEEDGDLRARHNLTKSRSERTQCEEIELLTKLTSTMKNATALPEFKIKYNLTAAQIDDLKTRAADATARLTKLQANSTLNSQCSVLNAESRLMDQCKEITRLSKMAALASNTTALSELQTKRNFTDAEMAKIKEHAQNASVKLTQLQSNTTLAAACKSIKTTSGDQKNRTGNANAAKSSTRGTKVVRSMSGAGQTLGNAVFVVVMGGVAALLMA